MRRQRADPSKCPHCPLRGAWLFQQRRSASLIGCLGQALFPCLFWVIFTHSGHASLRSLFDAVRAPLHAYAGSAVENLALRRASPCAADTFGFFNYLAGHVYIPARHSSPHQFKPDGAMMPPNRSADLTQARFSPMFRKDHATFLGVQGLVLSFHGDILCPLPMVL